VACYHNVGAVRLAYFAAGDTTQVVFVNGTELFHVALHNLADGVFVAGGSGCFGHFFHQGDELLHKVLSFFAR
jgi:hypothetical protein